MKKIDLGQTISILANIGVIAGIVFLALELNQNSELLAMQARSTLISTKVSQQLPLVNDESGIVDLWIASGSGEPLTAAETFRLRALYNMNVETWAALYREVTNGLLDESDIPIRYWGSLFYSPSMREWWETAKKDFDPEFVTFIEERVFTWSPE
jgi:hypothetical protein